MRQQLASTTVTVAADTQNPSIAQTTETGTAVGATVGFDGSYMFTPRFGTGVFARYASGSVDLPSVSGLKVAGILTGLGLRVRW